MVRVRLGFGRMSYGMTPGLYAMGEPTAESSVLVTANYKLTVDVLRRELGGRDLWILVLDTANVNVWCAAGKGTFGTEEVVRRIEATRLSERVTRRRLILPQLGAPGVAAHEVKKRSGFDVVYGPVRAADLPAFLDSGEQATLEMRHVTFPLLDRLVLTPVELQHSFFPVFLLALLVLLAPAIWHGLPDGVGEFGLRGLLATLIGWLGGCVLGPALLPWLPGRAFWVKGIWLGVALALVLALVGVAKGTIPALGGVLWLGGGVSFLLMNFTGCTTFTSLSGAKTELRALPGQIAGVVIGLVLWSTDWWR
jgi:acetyl-CoA decarbonylase/synthase complex subunit gamma